MAQPPPPAPPQAGTDGTLTSMAAQGSTNIQNRKQAVMSIHETQRQSVMKAMDARRTAAMAQAASLLDKAQGGSGGTAVAEALKSGAIPDPHMVAEAAAALKVAEYLKSLISEEVGRQMAGLLAAEVQRQLAGLVADEVRRQLNSMLSEATGIPPESIPQAVATPQPPPADAGTDGNSADQMPSAA